MAIYHIIVTVKGGPLNVSQSNLASFTVHWILYRLPKWEMLEGWKEDKADIACGFLKLCHSLRNQDITELLIVQRGKVKWKVPM